VYLAWTKTAEHVSSRVQYSVLDIILIFFQLLNYCSTLHKETQLQF